ncbi:hypothetical protein K7G98_30525, partial [Saccharothrix sp. MB29]|nr:hypothetical protein [Saccharothrix sp. MB29]
GLPAHGELHFGRTGTTAVGPTTPRDGRVRATRLSTTAALAAIDRHADLHPRLHSRATALGGALADGGLDVQGLLGMTSFAKGKDGWSDVVQAAVTDDLGRIMQSFIPGDLWHLIYPDTGKPKLEGLLAVVAGSPVPGVDKPALWYESLATAVMARGLADGSDENCQYLNGPRAGAWLRTQLATSKVYFTHGQQLFGHYWQQHNPTTAQYLADQVDNADAHATTIDRFVTAACQDIDQNVAVDATSPPHLKDELKAEVTAAGQYAKTNKLFWALAFHTYNTSSGCLAK